MVQALIDTHTLLWAVSDKSSLSLTALSILEDADDADNEIFLSVGTPWEISIKVSVKKLEIPGTPEEFVREQMRELGLRLLPIDLRRATGVATLPFHHRDPFDRMLSHSVWPKGCR